MATGEARIIGREDLVRADKAVAEHFQAHQTIVAGSQDLLAGRDDIERSLRNSRQLISIHPMHANGKQISRS